MKLRLVLGDERRQRVDALRVDVIEPRREHEVAAQLAPVFVRDDVVWVVGARAVKLDAADRAARRRLAEDDAVRAVGIAVGPPQQPQDVGLVHRPRHFPGRRDPGVLADDEVRRLQLRDVVFGGVIARGPEQFRRDDLAAGRHGAPPWRIELDEPELVRRIPDREAGCDAVALRRHDRPLARCRTVAGVRGARDDGRRQRHPPGAIHEVRDRPALRPRC